FGKIGIEERDEKFVAAHSYDGLFSPHVPHQKAAHFHEDGIACSVSVHVVVLLEVIYVCVDAAPLLIFQTQLRIESCELPSVVTSAQGITNALLDKLRLQILSRSDVDQDSMKDRLASFRVCVEIPG